MKLKIIIFFTALTLILAGCEKKEKADINTSDTLEDTLAANEKIEKEIKKATEDDKAEVLSGPEYYYTTDISLFTALDDLMSMEYNILDKNMMEIDLRDFNLETPYVKDALIHISLNEDNFNLQVNKIKKIYEDIGELNNRTLSELYYDNIVHNNYKTYLSNSNGANISALDRYADLLEERDKRLEGLGFNDLKTLDLDNFTTREQLKDLNTLLKIINEIEKDIDLYKFTTAEYRKLNAAYKVYYQLLMIPIRELNELNDYNYYKADSFYEHLEDEAAQEIHKGNIIFALEQAKNLKIEIDKIDNHMTDMSRRITKEVIDKELEKKEEAQRLENERLAKEQQEKLDRKEQEDIEAQKFYKLNDTIVSDNNDVELTITNFELKNDDNHNLFAIIDIEFKNLSNSQYNVAYDDFWIYVDERYIDTEDDNEYYYDYFGKEQFDVQIPMNETVKGTLVYFVGRGKPVDGEVYTMSYPDFPQFLKGYYSDRIILSE